MPNSIKSAVLLLSSPSEDRESLASLLSHLPAVLQRSGSVAETAAALEQPEIALVVLEGNAEGLSLVKQIRSQPLTRSVPIVLLMPPKQANISEWQAYEAGATDFLYRPWDERTVFSKVGALLALGQQRLELERQVRIAEGARKQADFLNRKLEAETLLRDRFVAALSHDLRTPLTASRLAAQLIEMQKGDLAPAVLKYAQKVIKNMDRADRMITDLLDVTRLEAGRPVPISLEVVDLDPLLNRLQEDLRLMYSGRVRVIAESGVQGNWNEEAIRRLVENLVSNAVKYGHPTAQILVRGQRSLLGVKISVHNEGPPIPKRDLERLFDRFHRAHSAEASGKPGWGIGLAVCRGIASALGGELRVRSEEGFGTEFLVEIPLDSRPFQESQDGSQANGVEKILVVDDIEATRYTLRRILERERYHVLEAASGTDALEAARGSLPALVLLNVDLADMSGPEVCRRLRALPELANTRFLLTSASPLAASDEQAGFAAGVSEILVQPVDPAELLRRVATHLDRQDTPLLSQ